ncbi:MAG: precorrin-3B synthase [Anderseniella sp.]
MRRPKVQGWCPGTLRPMMSGDGLLVRVRPRSGRLAAHQLAEIANLSLKHGNGFVDFSNRANLQIRGVAEQGHEALVEGLRPLELTDGSAEAEASRNILVTPFWRTGDGVMEIADELACKLSDCPGLPAKFGFAVDIGQETMLRQCSADIRIERAEDDQQLMLRADGMEKGTSTTLETAARDATEMARWFVESGGVTQGRGRMTEHVQSANDLPAHFAPGVSPARIGARPSPGECDVGFVIGFEFGQAHANQLRRLAEEVEAFRLTPWRFLILEGAHQPPQIDGLIVTAEDVRQTVSACTGKPGCLQAAAQTRPLARQLASYVPAGKHLHVSGCEKGCAHPAATDFTLIAGQVGFDLVCNGTSGDRPVLKNLAADQISMTPDVIFGAG